MDVSVVVVPRERFSSIAESLQSLFATIPGDVPVVVVEGCSPPAVRDKLRDLRGTREFDWVALDYFVTPQEARNIGLDRVATGYVVLSDNDIHYEPGWLEAMLDNARTNRSDLVAPLICIGPPRASKIHHAGGRLVIRPDPEGKPHVTEQHQLMNKPLAALQSAELPVENEIVEFHCFLASTDYLRRIGPLDERLITREQIDFGLRSKFHRARVTFEQRAVVTYMATTDYIPEDLPYMAFRWCDELAFQSLDAFTASWGIETDRNNTINNWIRPHRVRAFASSYPEELAELGHKRFVEEFVRPREEKMVKAAMQTRVSLPEARFPRDPVPEDAERFFEQQLPSVKTGGAPTFLHRAKPLVVAGMATMASRAHTFYAAVESILPQVDRLYLFLDRFDRELPFQHEKVVPLYSQHFGDLRANGKLLGLLMCGSGCDYLTVDDDIRYPDDYAARMLDFLHRHKDPVAVGVHAGSLRREGVRKYLTDRIILHRSAARETPARADLLGTCTAAFSTSHLRFDVRRWKSVNTVDLMFAIECQQAGIPRVAIPREQNWITCLEESQTDSIYTALRRDDTRQTGLARQLHTMIHGNPVRGANVASAQESSSA